MSRRKSCQRSAQFLRVVADGDASNMTMLYPPYTRTKFFRELARNVASSTHNYRIHFPETHYYARFSIGLAFDPFVIKLVNSLRNTFPATKLSQPWNGAQLLSHIPARKFNSCVEEIFRQAGRSSSFDLYLEKAFAYAPQYNDSCSMGYKIAYSKALFDLHTQINKGLENILDPCFFHTAQRNAPHLEMMEKAAEITQGPAEKLSLVQNFGKSPPLDSAWYRRNFCKISLGHCKSSMVGDVQSHMDSILSHLRGKPLRVIGLQIQGHYLSAATKDPDFKRGLLTFPF